VLSIKCMYDIMADGEERFVKDEECDESASNEHESTGH